MQINVLKNKFVFGNIDRGLLSSLFTYTIFIAINMLIDQINWNVDKMLLGRFKGTGAAVPQERNPGHFRWRI